MEKLTLTGKLSDNLKTIEISHAKIMRRVLSAISGKELEITVGVLRKRRSDAQNRYIWGVVVPVVRSFLKETQGEDYTKEEVYAWLRKLLGHDMEIREIAGEDVIVMTGKRFSKMNTKEFAEAIDLILKKMALQGCVIPEPNQHNFIHEFLTDD